jgi:tetratricopeptide (TPR) repeat protein
MLNNADPRSQPSFWIEKAAALLASGDPQKYAAALVCAQRAFNLAPHDAAALFILGSILLKTGKYSEAEFWLQKARSIDQDSTPIAIVLASTKYALGDLPDSVRVLSEAIASEPHESTRMMLRMLMADPVLASGDYSRGFALREGHELQATQEQGFKKKTELKARPVVPLPDQPLPRDRETILGEEFDGLNRGVHQFTDREIFMLAKKRLSRRQKEEKHEDNQRLIQMVKLMHQEMGHWEAARKVTGEPPHQSPVAQRLVRGLKKANKRYLANRGIERLSVGRSPSFVKKFTDEDSLDLELLYLDRCRPGVLRELCSASGGHQKHPRK